MCAEWVGRVGLGEKAENPLAEACGFILWS